MERICRMKEVFNLYIVPFFSNNITSIIVNILSTLVSFFLAFLFINSQKIKISKRILIGVNEKDNKEKRVAWKFKIVNKSIFTSFINFDIQLAGINYVKNSDDSYTQHKHKIDIYPGVRELTRNIPFPILFLKRHIKDDNSNIDFACRPLSLTNLNEEFDNYEEFELNILCTDTLLGKPHSFTRIFKKSRNPIERGNFTNDGRLNSITSLKDKEKEFIEQILDSNNKCKSYNKKK